MAMGWMLECTRDFHTGRRKLYYSTALTADSEFQILLFCQCKNNEPFQKARGQWLSKIWNGPKVMSHILGLHPSGARGQENHLPSLTWPIRVKSRQLYSSICETSMYPTKEYSEFCLFFKFIFRWLLVLPLFLSKKMAAIPLLVQEGQFAFAHTQERIWTIGCSIKRSGK